VAAIARTVGLDIYWNAPMQEDDIQSQISLVESVRKRGLAGLIISPIKTLPMRTPIQRTLRLGTPVVVVGTELGIPPGRNLGYVLNDEVIGGEIGARRLGAILHGQGSIAILGINPQLTSNITRERSFENTLTSEFPNIHVFARRFGFSSVPQEQQVAESLLQNASSIDAIVALSLTSTRGAYYAIEEFGKEGQIKLVGFDQDLLPPIRTGAIDSVVSEDTYQMGKIAMAMMNRELHGDSGNSMEIVPPILITRDNIDSPEIQKILNLSWWNSR
jgi:ribose transport system substrate-binding protein